MAPQNIGINQYQKYIYKILFNNQQLTSVYPGRSPSSDYDIITKQRKAKTQLTQVLIPIVLNCVDFNTIAPDTPFKTFGDSNGGVPTK